MKIFDFNIQQEDFICDYNDLKNEILDASYDCLITSTPYDLGNDIEKILGYSMDYLIYLFDIIFHAIHKDLFYFSLWQKKAMGISISLLQQITFKL